MEHSLQPLSLSICTLNAYHARSHVCMPFLHAAAQVKMEHSLRPGALDSLERRLKQLDSEVGAVGKKAAGGADKTASAMLGELQVGRWAHGTCVGA